MKRELRFLAIGLTTILLAAVCAPASAETALFEASAALKEGDVPTMFSVYPSAEHAEGFPDDPALLAQAVTPDGEFYSFLFPSYESGDTGFLPLLRFTDINGDGCLDVEAVFALGASNLSCTYFLYDPADGRVRYNAELGLLSNAYYDAERGVILSQVSDGAATQYYSLFDVAEGVPALVRTATMDGTAAQGEGYLLLTRVISAKTGEVLLDESVPFSGDQSAVWNAQYEKLMRALLEGYGEALTSTQP